VSQLSLGIVEDVRFVLLFDLDLEAASPVLEWIVAATDTYEQPRTTKAVETLQNLLGAFSPTFV
jgi:hypothetical protein